MEVIRGEGFIILREEKAAAQEPPRRSPLEEAGVSLPHVSAWSLEERDECYDPEDPHHQKYVRELIETVSAVRDQKKAQDRDEPQTPDRPARQLPHPLPSGVTSRPMWLPCSTRPGKVASSSERLAIILSTVSLPRMCRTTTAARIMKSIRVRSSSSLRHSCDGIRRRRLHADAAHACLRQARS